MLLDSAGRPIYSALPVSDVPRVPGIGAAKNLHLLWGRRFEEWNAHLKKIGGVNPHGGPNYRLSWGWQRPDLYGIGDLKYLEFFHLERWEPMGIFMDEEDWEARELDFKRANERYRIEPYPRHGEYVEIRVCRWGIKDENGVRQPHFRTPDKTWLEGALVWDFIRRDRTKQDVAEEVKETQSAWKQLEIERTNRIQDEMGIRDLAEKETALLIRNPSLRNDQSLMLAPN
jgi:hypothetical protein